MRILASFLLIGLVAPYEAHAVLTVQATNVIHETCTYGNGQIWVAASGGLPPYSFSWSDGPTATYRGGLNAGSYTVTVTDANLDQVSLTVDILSQPYQLTAIGGGVAWCAAPGNLLEDPVVSGVSNNWTVNGVPAPQWGTTLNGPTFLFHPDPWPSDFTYPVDDGNGCTGTITGSNGPHVTSWPELSITNVVPSCTDQNIGAIRVHSSGLAPAGLTWVNLIRDDQVLQPQAYQPDQGTLDVDFVNLEPGYYGIHWWLGVTAEELDPGQCSYDTIWVTVPSLGPNCGSVQGTSYIDLDADCVQDANDVGVPYSPLLIQPGDHAVLTNGSGHFAFGLFNGNYSLEQTDPTLVPICPVQMPAPFTVNSDLTTIDLANSSTAPLDLRVSMGGGVFRPGFNGHYHVVVINDSPQLSGPVTVTLELDPALIFGWSDPAPIVNGNTLTWNFPEFTSFQWMNWHVTVNVPVGTPLGTILSSTLTVSNTLPDGDPVNNSETQTDVVVGSYDPNDKHAQTSTRASGSLYFIDEDEWIDYTIRFQNTGTFPADFVVITDTIAPELDMLSFEQGVASHPFTVAFKPGRVIEWRFDDIQLPDSTTDEAGSHGLVKFRMKPVLPLVPGTEMMNVANIFFDYNDPVITEPSVLVAEFSTGGAGVERGSEQLVLLPNPTSSYLSITGTCSIVRIQVTDGAGRTLLSQNLTSEQHTLDLTGLSSGAYLLMVELENGSVVHERFVKNH